MLGVAEGLGFLSLERNHFFQPRAEGREVVLLPRFDPSLLAEHGGSRQLFDERFRQLRFLVILTAQLPDRASGVAVGIGRQGAFGQLVEPGAELSVGSPLMHETRKQGDLLRAVFGPGRGHHGPLIPTEEFLDRAQKRDPSAMVRDALEDLLIGTGHAGPGVRGARGAKSD